MAENKAIRPGGPGPGPRGPGHGPRGGFQKPKDLRGTLRKLMRYLGRYKALLVLVVVLLVISSACNVGGSYLLKPLINDYILPGDFPGLAKMLCLMAAVYVTGAACSYAYARIMVHVSQNTVAKIREDLFDKMQRLPLRYFDTHTHGELMSRYTNDIDTVSEALNNSFASLISCSLTFLGIIAMMIVLSPILTAITFLMLGVMLLVVKTVGSRSRRYFAAQQKAIGEVNGYIEEMIEGQKVIKVFNHEEAAKAGFRQRNEAYRRAGTLAQIYAGMMPPAMGNLSHVNYAITCCVGAILAIRSGDLGGLAAFLQYTKQVSQPINQISQQVNTILSAVAGAERIFEVMEEKPETNEGKVTLVRVTEDRSGQLTEADFDTGAWAWKKPGGGLVPVRGDVRFDHVVFGYDPRKTVLHDISLFAKPGQKIAFVGSTGAGKTTITNLINRFYEIQSGTITYDGIDVRDIEKDSLRRSLGVVLQDTHLFTGTVADNIRYGRLEATDEEVEAAARLAGADGFIRHLPHGYQTVLSGDGGNLSQGERQLLNIARAACANPPVLILDEATSSIDTRTEKIIEKGMDRLMAGRTVFVIAHRLSTVRNAKAIMVLEQGQIIERGDHEDLIAQRGRYYQLYTGQTELDSTKQHPRTPRPGALLFTVGSGKGVSGQQRRQQPRQQALDRLSGGAALKAQTAALQYCCRLAQHGKAAPARHGGGQDKAEAVGAQQGRQGKQLRQPHQHRPQPSAKRRQGPGQHIEKRHKGADGQHPGKALPYSGHKGGGKGYRLKGSCAACLPPRRAAVVSKQQPRQKGGQ